MRVAARAALPAARQGHPASEAYKTPLFLPWALCDLRGVRARRHWALGGGPVVGLPQAAARGAGLVRGVLREGCEGVH